MEIQRTDKRLRLIVSVAFLAAVAVGAIGLVVFRDWLDDVRRMPLADARRLLPAALAWIGGTAFLSVFLLGFYFWRIGTRIRAAAQFPLPGARVIRDTALLRGDVARRRGKVMQRIGAVLVLCALGLFAASWLLYSSLFKHAS